MIDFEKSLGLLADVEVRFVIVGGLAVTIHGSAHVTFDLDICYAREGENLARLTQALQPREFDVSGLRKQAATVL